MDGQTRAGRVSRALRDGKSAGVARRDLNNMAFLFFYRERSLSDVMP